MARSRRRASRRPTTTTRRPPRTAPHRAAPRTSGASITATHLERLLVSSDYRAFLASVPTGASASGSAASVSMADAARDRSVRAKLDGVREAFSGPYVVNGERVAARPMFRMLRPKGAAREEAVRAGARAAGVKAWPAIVGHGTPKQLVKITQALIDAGRLPPGPGDVATRIRLMQWDHGIGIDCGGYAMTPPSFVVSARGPSGDAYHATYRPR